MKTVEMYGLDTFTKLNTNKLVPKIKVNRHPKFDKLYTRTSDIDLIIAIGGRGGMKTYEVSKFGAYSSTIKKKRVGVLRDEKETIKESILNEIFARFDTANKNGQLEVMYEKLETGLKDRATGQMLVFTKGFRASSNDKRTNLKGVSEVDIAIIEEAEDIRDFNKFSTFKDSIRTEDRLIIVILNTPDIQHWIVRRYFNLEPITLDDVPELKHIKQSDLEGYWKLIPKDVPGFYCIQTSFEDNEHLNKGVIRDYKSYGDPNSNMYDLHYYLTAIKGFASSGRKGQVLRKVKPIKLAEYMAIDAREIIGQDFGTSAAAGTVGVKIVGNNLYARELNYKPLDVLQIAEMYCIMGLTNNDLVVADSAEDKTIGKLRRGWNKGELPEDFLKNYPQLFKGFNIRGVVKGPGSIRYGLNLLNSFNLFFVEDFPIDPKIGTTNLWNEVYNYIYAQNKEGEYTNDPIDDFNHLIDPVRYVAQSRGRLF